MASLQVGKFAGGRDLEVRLLFSPVYRALFTSPVIYDRVILASKVFHWLNNIVKRLNSVVERLNNSVERLNGVVKPLDVMAQPGAEATGLCQRPVNRANVVYCSFIP